MLIGHTASGAARSAVVDFAERTGVPCFVDFRAIGTLADDHPAYGGTLYQLARLPEGARPDVVLAVGLQTGFDSPGLRDGGAGWATNIVHVDADPAEVARFHPAALALLGDPDTMLVSLAAQCDVVGTWHIDEGWQAAVADARRGSRQQLDSLAVTDGERLHPYAAARAVSDAAAASGAGLVGDGAICKHWLHDALRLPAGSRYLTHGRFGCMGSGLGLAMGASISHPDRPTICVIGDGALGFALGEFEAMVRHHMPITVVVMNNARWGASRGFQMRPGGQQRVVGTLLSDADYHAVMVAFGGHGRRVAALDDLRDALGQFVGGDGPACINVSINDVGLAPEIPLLNSR